MLFKKGSLKGSVFRNEHGLLDNTLKMQGIFQWLLQEAGGVVAL